jgi:poly(3-hydroxybutyrate) depolymerase
MRRCSGNGRSSKAHRLLQPSDAIGSAGFRRLESRFRDWYAWTVDLPGSYYLQVVEQIFKEKKHLPSALLQSVGRYFNRNALPGFAGISDANTKS